MICTFIRPNKKPTWADKHNKVYNNMICLSFSKCSPTLNHWVHVMINISYYYEYYWIDKRQYLLYNKVNIYILNMTICTFIRPNKKPTWADKHNKVYNNMICLSFSKCSPTLNHWVHVMINISYYYEYYWIDKRQYLSYNKVYNDRLSC